MLARAMAAPAALRAQQVDLYAALALLDASVAAGVSIAPVVGHAVITAPGVAMVPEGPSREIATVPVMPAASDVFQVPLHIVTGYVTLVTLVARARVPQPRHARAHAHQGV